MRPHKCSCSRMRREAAKEAGLLVPAPAPAPVPSAGATEAAAEGNAAAAPYRPATGIITDPTAARCCSLPVTLAMAF